MSVKSVLFFLHQLLYLLRGEAIGHGVGAVALHRQIVGSRGAGVLARDDAHGAALAPGLAPWVDFCYKGMFCGSQCRKLITQASAIFRMQPPS